MSEQVFLKDLLKKGKYRYEVNVEGFHNFDNKIHLSVYANNIERFIYFSEWKVEEYNFNFVDRLPGSVKGNTLVDYDGYNANFKMFYKDYDKYVSFSIIVIKNGLA